MSFAEYEDIGREHSHTTSRPARVALSPQLSAISYQLSAASYQLPAASYQPSALPVENVETVLGEVERLLPSEAGRRHPSLEILQRVAHLVVS